MVLDVLSPESFVVMVVVFWTVGTVSGVAVGTALGRRNGTASDELTTAIR